MGLARGQRPKPSKSPAWFRHRKPSAYVSAKIEGAYVSGLVAADLVLASGLPDGDH